ncbi:MAG: phosphoglucosamine mutase, partial [Ilumatobacteraceae bacterium]
MSLKFGTDGVRAEALTVLTTQYVAALARAAAQVLGGGEWLIGRDTRESGPALEAAVAAGLAAAGAQPSSLGVVPTPALAWLSAERGVPAAMITASHNPWQDNGVKFFAPGGLKLPDDVERAIEALLQPELPMPAEHVPAVRGGGAYAAHLTAVSGRLDGVRLVLDCANGAMSAVAPAVFRALGADVVVIH